MTCDGAPDRRRRARRRHRPTGRPLRRRPPRPRGVRRAAGRDLVGSHQRRPGPVFWDLPVVSTPRPAPRPSPVARPRGRDWRFPMWMLVVGAVLLVAALDVPRWVWLIGPVVLLKRPRARGRRMHGFHAHNGRTSRSCA
ncbi:hypothetical protein LP418_17560 [Nocardioides sp. B-3]|nr:hypothetical protein [Nocardioides sp. B-3]UUZ58085.1 hypothetical protein LP418_17560 [Nocardioides sp. B-3]